MNLFRFPCNKLTIHVFICLINSRQNKMNNLCGFQLRSQKLPHTLFNAANVVPLDIFEIHSSLYWYSYQTL